MVRHSGSAVILAVDDSGPEPRVLLERQYRYAADDYLWELPAGRIDPGEKALAGAKRELLEETGYRAAKWTQALFFYPSPGFLDETMTVYLARGLTAGDAQPEEDESIECRLTPLSQALAMVRSGEIRDGKTIASVLWLAESLRSGSSVEWCSQRASNPVSDVSLRRGRFASCYILQARGRALWRRVRQKLKNPQPQRSLEMTAAAEALPYAFSTPA